VDDSAKRSARKGQSDCWLRLQLDSLSKTVKDFFGFYF